MGMQRKLEHLRERWRECNWDRRAWMWRNER